jgi:hypothetical protein
MRADQTPRVDRSIAVVYLARGSDSAPLTRFRRFVESYIRFPAAAEHDLFIIFKGFDDRLGVKRAQEIFSCVGYEPITTHDANFDLGAYRVAAEHIDHDLICFLNSNSEILSAGWLAKFLVNFDRPSVGIVGATGSFESLSSSDDRFPLFPNVHLRSNGFVIRREHALEMFPHCLASKKEAWLLESGPSSITRRFWEKGLSVVVVGRNGRGYSPQWWATSETFRAANQANLLIHDNVTREFESMSRVKRLEVSNATWGEYLDGKKLALLSSGWS